MPTVSRTYFMLSTKQGQQQQFPVMMSFCSYCDFISKYPERKSLKFKEICVISTKVEKPAQIMYVTHFHNRKRWVGRSFRQLFCFNATDKEFQRSRGSSKTQVSSQLQVWLSQLSIFNFEIQGHPQFCPRASKHCGHSRHGEQVQ